MGHVLSLHRRFFLHLDILYRSFRTFGSFRLKWTRGRQVTISDFDETSLMCALMFKKIARKISVHIS